MFSSKFSLITVFFLTCLFSKAQKAEEFGRVSYLFSLGASYNSVATNTGVGPLLSFSRFKNAPSNRFKWGWTLQHAEFYPYGVTDGQGEYYTMTSVGYTAGVDILRIKYFSLFLNGVAFVDLYRNVSSKNAYGFMPVASAGGELGLRYSNPNKRFGYQLTYVQARFGTSEAEMGTVSLAMEVRLRK
jgi:hypothetical protein